MSRRDVSYFTNGPSIAPVRFWSYSRQGAGGKRPAQQQSEIAGEIREIISTELMLEIMLK
jgi:hypothetical protein